jgi:GR25 family glycosyltransferase involved in LPS biosynthesis
MRTLTIFCFSIITLFAFVTFDSPVDTFIVNIDNKVQPTGVSGIDCVYVVNLPERTDRWNRMSSLLESCNIFPLKVHARNGWNLANSDLRLLAGSYSHIMRKGCYGALLSHLSVIKNALEMDYNIIWVLEDDVDFLENPSEILPQLIADLEKIDSQWDVLYTDTNSRRHNSNNQHIGYYLALAIDPRPDRKHHNLAYHLKNELVSPLFRRIRNRYGAYSLIISKRGIRKIFSYFQNAYVYSPIDIDIHYIEALREYCTTRDVVTNTSMFVSDTANPGFKSIKHHK